MAARFTMLLPRLAVLVVIWLLAAASYTFAAGSQQPAPTTTAEAPPAKPEVLRVPDVRGQPYVFAKGILQDAGFAWRVEGSVKGYSANTVALQNPAPGVRVIDNGAPAVVVRLERNPDYAEHGLPENSAPFTATKLVLLSDWKKAQQVAEPAEPEEAAPAEQPAPATTPEPEAPQPAATPEQQAPAGKKHRKPDFVVAGAPPEPAAEMPLPDRARLLARRVAAAPKSTRRLVNDWLYQHAWIVTGARFGWKDGDKALKTLIEVDRSLERRFGFGARSERVARRTLAYVSSRKR
jgi:PASTA domain